MNEIKDIAVVGMGYVGIASSVLFANCWKYDKVYGIQRESDRSKNKITQLNQGIYPLKGEEPHIEEFLKKAVNAEKFYCTPIHEYISTCDAVTITVQTPFLDQYTPDYSHIKQALHEVGMYMAEETLVVIESTITPGFTETVAKKILEDASGYKCGRDFMLAHAPERVMPGKLLANIMCHDRCIGGVDEASTLQACELYQPIMTKAKVIPMTATEAEIEKTSENAIRDLQIATANQLAIYCESMGVNYYNVHNGIESLRGYRISRGLLNPGAGVGGSCLTKDAYHLEHGFKNHMVGTSHNLPHLYHSLFLTAREINDYMPEHMLNLLYSATTALNNGKNASDIDIAILGWAGIGNSGDDRNTPSRVFYKLAKSNNTIAIHDPYVDITDWGQPIYKHLETALPYKDAIVIMTDHKEYCNLKPKECWDLMNGDHPIIIDGRNMVDADSFINAGFVYRGIGRGDKNNHEIVC